MDNLNKLVASLRARFLSMTPGARITTGLLLAVVFVSGALLFQQSQRDPEELLFGGEPFSNGQIRQIEAALASVGNDFQIVGNQVYVPRSKKDLYIGAVTDAGALPRNVNSILSDALQEGSFLDDHTTRQMRTQAARESQLSHLIGLMPWVDQASVIFTIEEGRGLKNQQLASATVSVLPRPGELLDGRRISNLKRTVAGWHPSLTSDKVTVTNLGDDLHECLPDTKHGSEEEILKIRTAYEQRACERIIGVLSNIPGVRVQVSANLEMIDERTDAPEALLEHSKNYKEHEVFASIAIPQDHIFQIWKQLHVESAEPTPEEFAEIQQTETARIQQLVRPLLPELPPSENQGNRIHVEVVNQLAHAPSSKAALSNRALGWTSQNWGALSILGLSAVGLWGLRSLARQGFHSSRVVDSDSRIELGEQPATENWESLPDHLTQTHSLKHDLSQLVNDNPQAAAEILRNWIASSN